MKTKESLYNMEEKTNIAELLKDCPVGMELYSPIYGDGVLTKVTNRIHVKFPKEHNVKCFRLDGKVSVDGEVMLFPKGKTSWNGLVPPYQFKDGDIVTCSHDGNYAWTCILKEAPEKVNDNYFISDYCSFDSDDTFIPYDSGADSATWVRWATEEEMRRLFKAIKDNGYEWNAETKTLEKVNPQYPKSYWECCNILDIEPYSRSAGYKSDLITAFRNLLICRDAYWKIAGEEMGLGKPWEPDWTNTNTNKYCIYYVGGEIKEQPMLEVHHLLAFPTKKIKDAFRKNFDSNIKLCETLL